MNTVILGEDRDSKFVSELKELIETRIHGLSVQMFFDINEFFDKIKFSDVDICLAVINNINFKECFQLADDLIEGKPRVRIAFLYDYVVVGWLDKINLRGIQLINKRSADMIGDIKKVISGEELKYVAEKILTPREEEILWFMSRGYKQNAIAEEIKISERTVRTHVANIYDKLGTSSPGAAVRRGVELGIIPVDFEIAEEF